MLNRFKRYENSTNFLSLAEGVIPLGSQTFSKSRTQYPVNVSPLYIDKASGSFVWDIDGNKYVDLVNSLAAITLGYCDSKIDRKVRKQLKSGVIYSLPGKLEFEVAKLITEIVPSAEMVRFGKNGTDATSAAVRLSRAFTGRDHILVCGYHGWQDWYIGTTSRNKGVPQDVQLLTHAFKFNDLESIARLFEKYEGQIAAVIMEPMNSVFPENGFLERIRELCTTNGTVLVFDETLTGFRVAPGGAQEMFGVLPDLTTLGKGIANGFPLSVITGKAEIMREMENIFFSGTFGGELLSLVAAKTVLEMHKNNEICPRLSYWGEELSNIVTEYIEEENLASILRLSGHASWRFLNWSPSEKFSVEEIKTLFMQEMFFNGVLVLNTHNMSTSFGKQELKIVAKAYKITLSKISEGINQGNLRDMLLVPPIIPLFKIR